MKKSINTWKLFLRTMRAMGKRGILYLFAIVMMSVTFAMFEVFSALLMKSVVDIAPTGYMKRLGVTIAAIVAGGAVSLAI